MIRDDARHVLIFDGACPMCVRWMGQVRHWDEHASFEYLPLQDPSFPDRFPDLDQEALKRDMHLVGPDGRIWTAAAAVEQILHVLPVGRWLGWLFKLPFARPIADRVYRRVADNRSRLGCGSHCGVSHY